MTTIRVKIKKNDYNKSENKKKKMIPINKEKNDYNKNENKSIKTYNLRKRKPNETEKSERNKKIEEEVIKKRKVAQYKDMLKPDLIKECRRKGLEVHGTKAHLVSLLVRDTKDNKEKGGGKMNEVKGQNNPSRHGQTPVVKKSEENEVRGQGDEGEKTDSKVGQTKDNLRRVSGKMKPVTIK